jgi:KUP system potassium uptake protein
VSPNPEHVLGVLSLVFWLLVLVVVVKYLTFVMRADNNGEGGVLSLLALVQRQTASGTRFRTVGFLVALIGTALLYGDGMITPAISVLSAIEGLDIAQPGLSPLIWPIALVILVGLFLLQRTGTAVLGAWFGPISLVWFVAIGLAGVPWIVRQPDVLAAINPVHAWLLLRDGSGPGILILGSVVLCVTGAEALYADLGHFGRRPIALAWYTVVLPSLLLSYFGQGAFLLHAGAEGIDNPFFAIAVVGCCRWWRSRLWPPWWPRRYRSQARFARRRRSSSATCRACR